MNKIINLNISPKNLFKKWLEITQNYHNLTNQQQDILALFLYHHFKLKQEITNTKILWKIVFDYDTKREIKDELGITDQVLQNTLTQFRKKNIVVKNTITPAFIPELKKENNNFKIIFNFNIING